MKTDALPTTAYLMMYSNESCLSNCAFCPQARESKSRSDKLSRISWPVYTIDEIIIPLKKNESKLKRICIQTIRFRDSNKKLLKLLKVLSESKMKLPLTVCCYPATKELFRKMKLLGVTRVGISFDCATQELFDKIKGLKRKSDITWSRMENAVLDAQEVFGQRAVSTHLIIGLGETEREALEFIQKFKDQKVKVGLFAFTPIKGTSLENCSQPSMSSYRRIQLARYLIFSEITTYSQMKFSESNDEYEEIISYGIQQDKLIEIIRTGTPFKTSGCPYCNRPFYNESPGKELYNYPWNPDQVEIEKIMTYFTDF